MKKNELLKLIEANEIIKKNNELLSITRNERFSKKLIPKEDWFPHIKELAEEFNILRKEVQSALEETINCKNYIQNTKCNHEVRLKHYELFASYSKCIFCDKKIMGNNCINWEYSMNRNKYCIDFIAKYTSDDEDYYIKDGYTNEQVYEIIKQILKDKKEDEEIDLVQEIKKLNLPNCHINEEKKVDENYILIIGGSNKQFIDNESYLYKQGLKVGLHFLKYFSSLLNTKIELIDNSETLESKDFKESFPEKNYNLKFTTYSTTSELEKILFTQKDIPFKIIIDLSELYEYKVTNNSISKEKVTLKLKELFPNSHIIRIDNLSKKSTEELFQYLKKVQDNNNLYLYQKEKYYHLESEEIKKENLENTCRRIKRLLRSKK